ncbi:ZmpA/ZmpB/ZmpC family metallo-endopeptidase, partial [Gemelliphila palaticanis]
KTITTKNYILNGKVEKTEEISSEITKEVVNQIVKVGTKKKETTKPTDNLTTEEKPTVDFVEELSTRIESIPFTELEEKTDELYEGEREIKVVGVAGEKTITTKNYILNGKVEKTEEISSEITKEVVNQIVKVGTKKKETVTTEKEVVPYTTEYIENIEKEYGYVNVDVEGINGEKTITKSNNLVIDEKITTSPTTKVVSVGTKPTEEREQLDYTTVYEANPEAENGTRTDKVSGETGEVVRTTTYTVDRETGVVTPTTTETRTEPTTTETRTEPTTKVVSVGTKPTEEREQLDYTTVYEANPEAENGTRTDKVFGETGEVVRTTTYTVDRETGVVTPTTKETRTEPTTKVVSVGTKPTEERTPINYTTVYEANPEAENGTRTDKVSGVNGEVVRTTTYTVDRETGVVTPTTTETRTEPTTKVVSVGTKPTEEREQLDYTTVYEANPELDNGTRTDKVSGINGEVVRTTTYTVDRETGVVTPTTKETRTEPTTKVVSVGTKPTEEREQLDYTTVYEANPEAENGTRTDKVSGETGEVVRTTTYTVDRETGVVTPTTTETRTEPTTKVVSVGTKPKIVVTSIEKTVRYVADNNIPLDQQVVEEEGENGSTTKTTTYTLNTTDGSVTEQTSTVTVEPKERVIKVGTQPKVERTEEPIKVTYQANDNLAVGQEQEVSAGSPKVTTKTTTYNVNPTTGEVTSNEPQVQVEEGSPRVVEKGTKPTVVTEEINFETEYREDANKYKDTPNEVLVVGKKGLKTTTTTYTVNEDTGAVTPTTNITTKDPVNEVIKVGTKERVKPTLEISTVEKDIDAKAVTASFNLNDTSNTALSSKARLYKGNELVRELDISNIKENLIIDNLEYYKDYTLKTVLTYDLGNGQVSEEQIDVENFRLDYKKIEIKDIDEIGLYEKEGNNYIKRFSLNSIPNNVDNYFIKIKSDKFKEVLLPVKSVVEGDSGYYNVVASIPELVQDKNSAYKEDFTLKIDKAAPSEVGSYNSFKSLIDAIKANPTGTFKLASDMSASEVELDKSATSYIPVEFRGTLIGSIADKNYAIHDLVKPLFDKVNGASISKLDLKSVDIKTDDSLIGALAKVSNNSNITDVSVSGSVVGKSDVGGIFGRVENNSIVSNVSFEGIVRANNTANIANTLGGIAANLKSSSSITKAKVDIEAYITANEGKHKAGSLVGTVESSTLSDSYAKGSITNQGKAGQVGGVVGSTYYGGNVNNIVSEVATNANKVHGDSNYGRANITNVKLVNGVASGKDDKWSTNTISKEEATNLVQALGITTTLSDSSKSQKESLYTVDYSSVADAQSGREVAYHNIEKLMPFYNKELIVYYGNKVSTDSKLYNTKLIDVVSMSGNNIVTDISTNKNNIDKIMLHYADNTVSYMNVSFKEDFKNNHVTEYNLSGTDLIYTPEEMISDYGSLISKLTPILSAVNFDSPEVRAVVGLATDTDNKKLSRLYLEEQFNEVKANLNSNLLKVLSMNNSINTRGVAVESYILDKIKKDKEAFMIGLSYMQRWYNINYGDINTKDMSTFKFDFFGNNLVNTIDELIKIGKSGYDNIQASNNYTAYSNLLAKSKNKDDLFKYIESYRALFLPNKDNADWFKENSKAYIVETLSNVEELRNKQQTAARENPYTHRLYNRITQDNWQYRNMVLPLLTMKEESVYAITTLSTISFGGYERYRYDADIPNGDVKTYVRSLVDRASEWQRNHFDFWYKILSEENRAKLAKSVLNYDGFRYMDAPKQNSWKTLDDTEKSIQDFFGPVGKWYQSAGAIAYANGVFTHFAVGRILDRYGSATYTHEMVHNFDGNIYFGGYGRREGQGAELFAEGLLQSPDYIEQPVIGINHIFDGDPDTEKRMHTNKPNTRFNNATDLKNYFHGMFDVIYTLEYAEAQSLLSKSNDVKQQWFRKIENKYIVDKDNKETHAGNVIKALTSEDVAKLSTFESLIDNNILTRRNYSEGEKERNGYYTIALHAPLYAALSNEKGSPGDIMFRRMAFELLAAKGYEEAFVPYVSGKYGKEAQAGGSQTWSNWYGRYLPLITDTHVFNNILKSEYNSWADFKKAMYNERINKKELLKPITIRYELGAPNSTKTVTIENYAQLQALIDAAVEKDMTNIQRATEHAPASWVNLLKERVYNAYLNLTNDFTDSIYK